MVNVELNCNSKTPVLQDISNIRYRFPKSHIIAHTINIFEIGWYKVHYPIL